MGFKEKLKDIIKKISAYLQEKPLKSILIPFISVIAPLTVITTTVVILRIGNFLPNEVDIFFLVPKEPEFTAYDDKVVWKNETDIEVFKSEYVNGHNEITVLSSDGSGIIAPGTENSYTFNLKNNGNIAIDYTMNTAFSLKIDGEVASLDGFPLLIKLKKAGGDYLIGGEDVWTPVGEAVSADDSGTLGINSYDAYTLEIKWIFDGDHELDTELGNLSTQKNMLFCVNIDTHAEENHKPGAVGGLHSPEAPIEKIGGRIEILPFTLLVSAVVLGGAGLTGALILRKKK